MKTMLFGATGYTGSYLLKYLCERQHQVIAHIRPNSNQLEKADCFEKQGAEVDVFPWEFKTLKRTLKLINPDAIFSVLGTTKKRKRESETPEEENYHHVDYGLNKMLIDACIEAGIQPTFIYLSAAGVSAKRTSKYMQARYNVEEYLAMSGLPYRIARPSFITGPDRDEDRPSERIGALLSDALLSAASLIGFVGFKKRYVSIEGSTLAKALIVFAETKEFNNKMATVSELIEFADRF